ncbi:MAG TPA: hypothetical protein VF814_15420 [Casimicrobiaceae bacterium]
MATAKLFLITFFISTIAWSANAAELRAQESAEYGVTVAVTPLNVAAGAKAWEFKVTLDTHSQDLSDDLTKSAVLLDGTGASYKAVDWEGSPAGGHHREGVLRFKPPTAQPKSIELRVERRGEPQPRSFRWELN